MEKKSARGSFTGSLGFVLAAAGSAVGLGNIWRFPYLAAKDGGGIFLLCYLLLVLTFGFTLLTTEIAIGRKTGQSPLTAYKLMHSKMGWLGGLACVVPIIILPYYSTIGGWVLKYLSVYLTGHGEDAVNADYFDNFIASTGEPIIWFVIYLAATMFVVYKGVGGGIERLSKILMPILLVLIIIISVFSVTLNYTDDAGITRTGLEGLKIYVIPDFEGMTLHKFASVLMDAMGQLFYSISVAMGIMITYGSYVKKDTNLVKSVNHIEVFDTGVAFLAGLMIIPAVYTFMGREGLEASGPGLMFQSLPRVFGAMGGIGTFVGVVFFLTVTFAALTSSVSIAEAITSSFIDKYRISRNKAIAFVSVLALVMGIAVCLGYNVLFFDISFPNGSHGQILDVFDYISNYFLMPITAIITCVLVGWVIKPKSIIDEICLNGENFKRKYLYITMIKFVAPALLVFLLLQSLGLIKL